MVKGPHSRTPVLNFLGVICVTNDISKSLFVAIGITLSCLNCLPRPLSMVVMKRKKWKNPKTEKSSCRCEYRYRTGIVSVVCLLYVNGNQTMSATTSDVRRKYKKAHSQRKRFLRFLFVPQFEQILETQNSVHLDPFSLVFIERNPLT